MSAHPLFYLIIGLALPVSHIFAIDVGIVLKVPELLLVFLLLFWFAKPTLPKTPEIRSLWLVLAIALAFLPLISNIFSLFILDQIQLGAAWLHNIGSLGRKNPISSSWILLGWNLFSLAIVFAFSTVNDHERKLFFKGLAISILFLNLYSAYDAFVNLYSLPDIPWPGDARRRYWGHFRAGGFFIEPLNLGHFTIYALGFLNIKPELFKSRMIQFIFVRFNLGLSVLTLILTTSTSAFFALIVALVLTFLLFSKFSKKDFAVLLGSLVTGILLAAVHPVTRHAFIMKIVDSFLAPTSVGHSLIDRLEKMKSGFRIFMDYPIFGAGLNSSGLLYPLYQAPPAFHYYEDLPFPLSEYVRLLAEVGIVGLSGFLIFVIFYVKILQKYQRLFSKKEILFYGVGFFGSLIAFLFSGLFNVYFIWIFVGLSLSVIEERRAREGVQ